MPQQVQINVKKLTELAEKSAPSSEGLTLETTLEPCASGLPTSPGRGAEGGKGGELGGVKKKDSCDASIT